MDYHAAIAPGGGGGGDSGASAICCCRTYFDGRVAAAASAVGGFDALGALCSAAMERLKFLHFGVENGARPDQTASRSLPAPAPEAIGLCFSE